MALFHPFSSPRFAGSLGSWIAGAVIAGLCHTSGFADETYRWSVQYLIDNSQAVMGHPQVNYPRHNRGLALSPDGKSLYATYLHSFNHSGEVRRIRLDEPDYENATIHILPGIQAKAIAVDGDGRVYLAETDQIAIFDARLRRFEYAIDVPNSEGVAVTKEDGKLIVYASVRTRNVLTRWELATKDGLVTNATPKGLGGGGEMKIPEAVSLRSVAVDKKGRIWVADHDGNRIFRVSSEGKDVVSKEITTPEAMAFDGERCLITQDHERSITITDLDMNLLGTLSVPWEELELAPLGNNHTGSLAGIVVVPGQGFFVANEGGQTAGQRSTYGREDRNSRSVDGKFFNDAFLDDNEPILHATPVPDIPTQSP